MGQAGQSRIYALGLGSQIINLNCYILWNVIGPVDQTRETLYWLFRNHEDKDF